MTEQKKVWVKPNIKRHKAGLLNKFGAVAHHGVMDSIDNVDINDLIKEHGSPLFIISEQKLRRNYKRLHKAFASRYPRVQFGWSYKTNYLGAVCNILHQEGAWAEVVSGFEYEKARKNGVPGKNIIFNGPHKTRKALEIAIEDNAHIHIDHLDEMYLIEDIATEKNQEVNVSIRLNLDTGFTEPWSRFGFNVESGQAMDVAWRIRASKKLHLTGLHCHIGTFILEPRAYTAQVTTMCHFMNSIEAETKCKIDVIDIGGGFASKNALQGVYLPPEQIVPSTEQYAEAICDTLLSLTHERESRGCSRPLLILETGRAMIDDTEVLVSTVVANKRLPDGRRGVVIDAGVNILFTAFWYNHDVYPTRMLDGVVEETVLYGPLCMNIDVIRQSLMLPPVNVGDSLVLTSVGAYNNTQWMQFIEYRPRVIMVHPDESVSVIREREDLAYVSQLEHLPDHLRSFEL